MLLDAFNLFADAVATGAVGTNLVGDVIDLQKVRDIGAGKQIFVNVVVNTAITGGAGGTYQVKLSSGTDSSLAGAVDHLVSASFATDVAGGIPAGTVLLRAALPMEGVQYKQFLGIQEVVGTANTTAGKIDAYLTFDEKSYKAYPDAVK